MSITSYLITGGAGNIGSALAAQLSIEKKTPLLFLIIFQQERLQNFLKEKMFILLKQM